MVQFILGRAAVEIALDALTGRPAALASATVIGFSGGRRHRSPASISEIAIKLLMGFFAFGPKCVASFAVALVLTACV